MPQGYAAPMMAGGGLPGQQAAMGGGMMGGGAAGVMGGAQMGGGFNAMGQPEPMLQPAAAKGRGRSFDGAAGGQGPRWQHHAGKIFVGNLPSDIKEDVVKEVFGTYGTVVCVHLMQGKCWGVH